jgi:serine/threonine-protein kinase
LIAYFLGDITNLKKAVNDFIVTSRQSYNNLDMTLGLSSVLLGCSILLETLEESHIELVNQIIIHGNKILDEIWNKIDSYDTIGIEKGLPYLGLAHGWAGILYASLRWYLTSRQSPRPNLEKRLIELYRLAQIDNTVANWPLYKGSIKSRTGWCHGSSGYVHLWLLANCMFDDQIYLDMAIKAGEHIWKHSKNTFSSIGQLCCGLAGQSYSFLELYKYTSAIKWLKRAKILGYKSERLAKSSHHLPNSLYKGEIGIALLLADLDNPNEACMPMFGSEKLIRSLKTH